MHFRGAFSKSLAPGYRVIVFETYKERPIMGKALVNSKTSKRAYEEDFEMAGLGVMAIKPEGGPVQYDDAVEGNTKRYLWTTYSKAWRITEELVEDDLYGLFGSKMSKSAGRSARNNVEVVMHAPYNAAFTNTTIGFKTGTALCDTHTSLRGLSQSNMISSDLDILALQTGLEHFMDLEDESGFPMIVQPKLLVHGVADEWTVKQLLKSTNLPGTDQNDINPVSGSLTPHNHHGFITDADDWFIVADEHDVNYFLRRALRMANGDDTETGDAKFRATQRHGSGFGDWRGIFGGQGQ